MMLYSVAMLLGFRQIKLGLLSFFKFAQRSGESASACLGFLTVVT